MPSQRKREPSPQCSCQGGPASCGKNSTYQRHHCGCDPCVESQRVRVAANVAKRTAERANGDAGESAPVAASVTPSAPAKSPQKSNASPATLDFGPKVVPASQVWRPRGWKPLDRDFEIADKPGRKK